ncbi:transaldolase/EF-hand domain-containing protein [Symmachiella macrocystis]|uniref:Transaldolase/EF-hand domain-containing protein n=1 Tax=Symmachiella macrocystis TaxID=2527985 RepID=A0A5C6AZX2_9PLAN|nr:EF-hand domain-containing protein [Symmachiella macrocystis]TWU05270.1 transaldolase/EF-hand domain-containing protein [Symmachiella macrocystis]
MTGPKRFREDQPCKSVDRLFRALLCLAVVMIFPATHVFAEETGASSPDHETLDLIYLAPRAPIFVRFRVRSEGKGFFTQRQAYSDKLFDELDESGDGVLKEAELEKIPPVGHLVPVGGQNTTGAGNLGTADTNADGRVTREEFNAYILAASGSPFQMNTEVQALSPGQSIRLFDRLDRDHDNRLSDDELTQAARRLRLMDFNLDEQITAEEIPLPTVFGVAQQNADTPEGQAAASLSLLKPIHRNHVDDALIRRLVQLYDKLSRGPTARRFVKDGKLSAKELGLAAEVVSPLDHNQDKLLDQQELRDFLANPQPIVEIQIEFDDESTAPAIKMVVNAESPPTAPLQFVTHENGDVLVRLTNVEFKLVASPKRPAVRAKQYRAFVQSDGDKNEYLDENEFGSAIRRFGTNQFQLVDTDGDGMIVKEEYTSFVTQQSELQKHVLNLNLASKSESLFGVVDTTADSQLDAKELAELKSKILALDRNGDGNIDRDELAGGMEMILARGDASIPPMQTYASLTAANASWSTGRQRATGNGWFAKMDRNRDRKLTKREFLGPLDVFQELDLDGNGWLDAKEAKQ